MTARDTSQSRVLVIKMSSLGDIFHALPTTHSLKSGLGARLDWVVNSQYADTVACFGDVDRVIPFPRKRLLAGHAEFIRELQRERYDLVCDLQGLLKSAYVARRARAKRRIGASFCRELAHLFYRELAGPKNKDRHAVEECLDIVRYLGLEIDRSPPPLNFPDFETGLARPRVAFAPVSRWQTKDWPPEHFVHLGQDLQRERKASILIVGGPDEKPVCDGIAAKIGGACRSLAGETSIPELGGVLQAVDLLVAVDSGPVHIAAALGTPVLGLYGITDPVRTGPYGPQHRTISAEVNGSRHGDFRKATPENLIVMRSIEAGNVVAAALDMLPQPASLS